MVLSIAMVLSSAKNSICAIFADFITTSLASTGFLFGRGDSFWVRIGEKTSVPFHGHACHSLLILGVLFLCTYVWCMQVPKMNPPTDLKQRSSSWTPQQLERAVKNREKALKKKRDSGSFTTPLSSTSSGTSFSSSNGSAFAPYNPTPNPCTATSNGSAFAPYNSTPNPYLQRQPLRPISQAFQQAQLNKQPKNPYQKSYQAPPSRRPFGSPFGINPHDPSSFGQLSSLAANNIQPHNNFHPFPYSNNFTEHFNNNYRSHVDNNRSNVGYFPPVSASFYMPEMEPSAPPAVAAPSKKPSPTKSPLPKKNRVDSDKENVVNGVGFAAMDGGAFASFVEGVDADGSDDDSFVDVGGGGFGGGFVDVGSGGGGGDDEDPKNCNVDDAGAVIGNVYDDNVDGVPDGIASNVDEVVVDISVDGAGNVADSSPKQKWNLVDPPRASTARGLT